MHLPRLVSSQIESLQLFTLLKPVYIPYTYRGTTIFAFLNFIMLMAVHYTVQHRLQSFYRQAEQLEPVVVSVQ